MKMSLTEKQLLTYLSRQLDTSFPDENTATTDKLYPFLKETLSRLEYSFSKINNPYYYEGGNVIFNHLHSDQYASFLYLYSNIAWKAANDKTLATKLYYLNKTMNGIDIYYEVKLPDIFCFNHAVGIVIGRAEFNNYLCVYQNCTIAGSSDHYPILGEGVALYAGASVIGKTHIGNNCHIAAQTCIKDSDIPDNSVVFGSYPNYQTKTPRANVIDKIFKR